MKVKMVKISPYFFGDIKIPQRFWRHPPKPEKVIEKMLRFSRESELETGEYRKGCIAAIQDDIGNIKHLPTADVVEVVRCKDCEHRYVPCHCALWYATANGTEYFIERGDDFSCSYGKKKEGAEE